MEREDVSSDELEAELNFVVFVRGEPVNAMTKALTGPGTAKPIRLRVVLLAAAGALVIALLWGRPQADVVEAAGSATASGARVQPAAGTGIRIGFSSRKPGPVIMNLFESHSWYRAPPPSMVAARPAAPPVPTAPPFPFSYFGKYERSGDKTVYFLAQGDRVYDVHVGDVLDNTYSVDGVQNGQLRFTYLPLKIEQAMSLGDER